MSAARADNSASRHCFDGAEHIGTEGIWNALRPIAYETPRFQER
jgi:hypothetical protein